jgi:hypothetical protein
MSVNFGYPLRLKEDLQDQDGTSLVDPMGECTFALLNLVIFGKATPYLHNGTMRVEDENGMVSILIKSNLVKYKYHKKFNLQFCDREGISGRSDIGYLIWDKDEEKTNSYNLGYRV